jgi:hypothetical protein
MVKGVAQNCNSSIFGQHRLILGALIGAAPGSLGAFELLDQPAPLLGSIAPTTLHTGNDFNTLDGLRRRCMPRLKPRPSRLRQVSSRIGGWST